MTSMATIIGDDYDKMVPDATTVQSQDRMNILSHMIEWDSSTLQ